MDFIIQSGCMIDDKVWVISRFDSYLYCLKRENDYIEEVCDLSRGENIELVKIYRYKENLVVIPRSDNYIIKFNIATFEKTYIDIPIDMCEGRYNFATSYIKGDYIYLFGYHYCGIIKTNLDTYKSKIIVYDGSNNRFKNEKSWLVEGVTEINNHIFATSQKSNYLLEIDCDNDNIDVHEVGKHKTGYTDVVVHKDKLWLLSYDFKGNKLVSWDLNTKTFEEMEHEVFKNIKETYPFRKMIPFGESLYIFSFCAKKNIVFYPKTKEVYEFDDLYDTKKIENWKYKYIMELDGKIFYLANSLWGCMDVVNDVTENHEFETEKRIKIRFRNKELRDYMNNNCLLVENETIGLEDFINVTIG